MVDFSFSDPTPSTSSVTYSVETAMSGRLLITVDSPGAYGSAVTYSGSVVEGSTSGSVVVTGNMLSVSGLDYRLSHTVNISGSCSGFTRTSQFSYTFNIAGWLVSLSHTDFGLFVSIIIKIYIDLYI